MTMVVDRYLMADLLVADIRERLAAIPRILGDDMRALPPIRQREEVQADYEHLFAEASPPCNTQPDIFAKPEGK